VGQVGSKARGRKLRGGKMGAETYGITLARVFKQGRLLQHFHCREKCNETLVGNQKKNSQIQTK